MDMDCKICLNEAEMECGSFRYLGSELSKDGGLENEVEGRVYQDRRVLVVHKTIAHNWNVSDGVVFNAVPTLTYGRKTRTCLRDKCRE